MSPGETLATLDGVGREIAPDMLVIADARKPVAVAGVMGGAGSEIRPETTTVLLESACFKATDIRRTSKTLGLMTESSYRYECGVDPQLADWASRRASMLMTRHAGAAVLRGVIDVFAKPPEETKIPCRFQRIRDVIGAEIPDARIMGILKSIELRIVAREKGGCVVHVPTFRVDLSRETDLVEEVARLYGLDNIPAPSPRVTIVPGATNAPVRARMECRSSLVGLGLMEITSYSFVSERLLDIFNPADKPRRIYLPNPISADHSVLRNSLIPQMVETLGLNRSRQATEAALFEMGRVFFKDEKGALGEEERVAIGLTGPVGRSALDKVRPMQEQEVFQWARGLLEAFCTAQRVLRRSDSGLGRAVVNLREADVTGCEKGRAAAVAIDGDECGMVGLLDESVRREWRLAEPVAVMELRLAPLLKHVFDVPAAAPLSPYPSVSRDVAMVVEERVRHEDVLRVVQERAPAELAGVRLFDIYRSQAIGAGKKSMACSMTYRSLQKTLTDEEANQFHERIKEALRATLGAEIRDK